MKFKEVIKQRKFRSPQAGAALNIIFTANLLEEITRNCLKPYSISGEQFNVLRILRGNYPEAYTLQEVRDRMLNRWSNVSRLVEKLRQKGYLNRCPMESNRRKVEIRITDEGLSLLDELEDLSIARDLYEEGLTSDQAEQLSSLLDAFRTNLEQYIQENS